MLFEELYSIQYERSTPYSDTTRRILDIVEKIYSQGMLTQDQLAVIFMTLATRLTLPEVCSFREQIQRNCGQAIHRRHACWPTRNPTSTGFNSRKLVVCLCSQKVHGKAKGREKVVWDSYVTIPRWEILYRKMGRLWGHDEKGKRMMRRTRTMRRQRNPRRACSRPRTAKPILSTLNQAKLIFSVRGRIPYRTRVGHPSPTSRLTGQVLPSTLIAVAHITDKGPPDEALSAVELTDFALSTPNYNQGEIPWFLYTAASIHISGRGRLQIPLTSIRPTSPRPWRPSHFCHRHWGRHANR